MRSDPIVILGMHRSGTTLLAQVLLDFGVFLGQNLTLYNESEYFIHENERLFRIAHGGWDVPYSFEYLLEVEPTREKCLEVLQKRIQGLPFLFSYAGWKKAARFFGSAPFHWGWKDPRTTVTWPFWNALFPKAKYLFIYRNGVDVANSLWVRERERLTQIHNRFLSLRCASLSGAFQLWEEYNDIFFKYLNENPEMPLLNICYEDMLAQPLSIIDEILHFLEIPATESQKSRVSHRMRRDRRYGFTDKPSLVEFYESVKDSFMMKKLGYSEIEVPQKKEI